MTVTELIELLQEFNGDDEVRIATQPNYPIAVSVAGAWAPENTDDGSEGFDLECVACGFAVYRNMFNGNKLEHENFGISDHEAELEDEEDAPEGVAWIATGSSDSFNPYAVPRNLWDRCDGNL